MLNAQPGTGYRPSYLEAKTLLKATEVRYQQPDMRLQDHEKILKLC